MCAFASYFTFLCSFEALLISFGLSRLGQTDEVLQEELAASAMQKKTILASHGIEEDCWKLLVGLFQ